MAMGIRYVCSQCSRAIEAWDDGDPYFFNEAGEKQYAYHPDLQRELCVGVDSPMLCLDCGHLFSSDSQEPAVGCPNCRSQSCKSTFELNGKTCPSCRSGTFEQDPDWLVIS